MADGTLRRVKLAFERNYTQMPNEWHRDSNLSLTARGLLGLLMSHDEGWSVTHKTLVATNPEGRTAIETAVKELKAAGYLKITPRRGRGARVDGWEWELTDPVEAAREAANNQLAGFPNYGTSVTRKTRTTENQHLKEQHLEEHLTKELKADHSTRAGINEDASGDSHHAATETPEQTYQRYLHQPCKFRAGKEHDRTPTTPCTGCGLRIDQYWDDRGDIRHLSDLLAVSS